MIIMLYDEAVRQIDHASQLIDSSSRKYDEISNSILKAQDIITELTVSLDFEQGGEIAPALYGLYRFFNNQLMEGNVQKDSKPIKEVRRMLVELRGAWSQIVERTSVEGRGQGGFNIAG